MPIVVLFTFNYFFIPCLLDKGQFKFSFSSDDGEITTYYGILKYLDNEEEVIIPNTYKTCEVRYIFEKVFS